MQYHFISIGGSAMHSLALALADAGHQVSGSDDALHEPALGHLQQAGLAPEALGWFPEKIHAGLSGVLLGMHARADNPELLRARELGLPIWSFPDFIRHHADQKQRIVIAGSHGKSTVTGMVMHALRKHQYPFDYLVGAPVPGFERTVRLSAEVPIILLEGDEYPASALDLRAKFQVYAPHMLVLTGIAWDHVNVYQTEAAYLKVFEDLIRALPKGATVVYNRSDRQVRELVKPLQGDDRYFLRPFDALVYRMRQQQMQIRIPVDSEVARKLALEAMRKLKRPRTYFPMQLYGEHNMYNLAAALEVCRLLALEPDEFLEAMEDFTGVGLRLQTQAQTERTVLIRDFAHAPSKVQASVGAVRERYPTHHLIAVLELHTYSSLSRDFLPRYRGTLRKADQVFILMDPQAAALKKLPPPTVAEVRAAFGDRDITVLTDAAQLPDMLFQALKPQQNVLLLMSSGSLGGLRPEVLTL